MKYNLTSSDKAFIRELADVFMYGNDASEIIRLKQILSRKNNKIKKYENNTLENRQEKSIHPRSWG